MKTQDSIQCDETNAIKVCSSLSSIDLQSVQVIIPALNEEDTIGEVILNLQKQGLVHIRVVDNGSSDFTASVARSAGAEVVSEPHPGYGRAAWKGMENLSSPIEWILFCDADGSDVVEELPRFFRSADEVDFVLGNRRSSREGRKAMTAAQNFGNWLATSLIRLGWGGIFEDLGPLRLIRRASLDRLKMQDRGFGWTVEMQARAVEERLRISEIPVRYRDRQGGESKISGTLKGSVNAGVVILGTLGKLYSASLAKRLETSVAQRVLLILSACLLLAGSLLMEPAGDFRRIGSVPDFLTGAALMSLGFLISLALKNVPGWAFWGVALVARLILLPMFPGDDIWRYLWEGWIQNHGFSPYAVAPLSPALEPLRTPWWELINHPDVAAIYPPLAQAGFRLLAFITPSVWLFKLSFIAADLGCCLLLARRFGTVATLVYAWNPLVIYCFAGGGHYDAWFLLPLVAAWMLFETPNSSRGFGALLLGVSVALKYISLPVVGFVAWKTLREKGIRSALGVCLLALIPFAVSFAFIPSAGAGAGALVPTKFVNIARTSEFIPYWVGLFWPDSIRMNGIFSIPVAALALVLIFTSKSFGKFCENYLFGLLLFSPAVNGWYFTWLAPFAVSSRNRGTLLVSMSGFVYFWLKHREAVYGDWEQSVWQKLLLWLPLIIGFVWQIRHSRKVKLS